MMLNFDVGSFLHRPKLFSEYHQNLKELALFCVDLTWNDPIYIAYAGSNDANHAFLILRLHLGDLQGALSTACRFFRKSAPVLVSVAALRPSDAMVSDASRFNLRACKFQIFLPPDPHICVVYIDQPEVSAYGLGPCASIRSHTQLLRMRTTLTTLFLAPCMPTPLWFRTIS